MAAQPVEKTSLWPSDLVTWPEAGATRTLSPEKVHQGALLSKRLV